MDEALASAIAVEPAPATAPASSLFVSTEEQLLALNREYETWLEVYNVAGDRENELEEAGHRRGSPEFQRANVATQQAIRRARAILRLANSVVPTTPLGWASRARLIAAELAEWWDDDDLEEGERACRALLDQIMSTAGVARIPRRDFSPEEILADIRPKAA